MLNLDAILSRKREASGFASSQIRTLALAFVAISWALLTAHDEPLKGMASNVDRYVLLGMALFGVLVMICDLLQYLSITVMADSAAKRAEMTEKRQGQYDRSSLPYKAQGVFFWAKFSLLSLGAVTVVWAFASMFFALPRHSPIPAAKQAVLTGAHDVTVSRQP